MSELINGLQRISSISQLANFHGTLAMLSLILFGAAIVLYFFTTRLQPSISWLKSILTVLFIDLTLLDIAGLITYIPYRGVGGSKSVLIASENTAWLHNVIFEHKEFLAFAPPLLIFSAMFIVFKLGNSFGDNNKVHYLRLAVISSILLSLLFVLVVAGEAVLVTKAAPI